MKHTPHTLILFLGLAAGCGAGAGDRIADEEDAIQGGTTVANSAQSGFVMVGGVCSGTLIANDWVLTAKHCGLDVAHPSTISVQLGNGGDPARQTTTGVFAVDHPSLDYTLIRLNRALSMNGSTSGFQTGLYPDTTASLAGLNMTLYGYGFNNCTGGSCSGFGTLRSANVTGSWTYDEYNHGGLSPTGQQALGGDSGGGLVLEGAAGRSLAGVTKCGTDCTGNPENFREWVLSYMYGRAVALPEVWAMGCSDPTNPDLCPQHPYFGAKPLENNYRNHVAWSPCPDGRTYTWSASYDLETFHDYIDITSNGTVTTLNGRGTQSGIGAGLIKVDIRTDAAGRSPGLLALPITCSGGIGFSNPWGTPVIGPIYQTVSWDPCPGGDSYTYSVNYQFDAGSIGYLAGVPLSGSGSFSATARGAISVEEDVNPGLLTPGIRTLSATCDLGIECHGQECFTVPATIGNNRHARVTWNPCNNRPFTWQAAYDFENGFDFARISGTTIIGTAYTSALTGRGISNWTFSAAPVTVDVSTDFVNASAGLSSLKAICTDWGAWFKTGIQVQAGSYGENCGGNRGNKSSFLARQCNGQDTCDYTVDYHLIGDPVPGCAKDYLAEWTCGMGGAMHTAFVGAEAGFGSVVHLSCP